MRLRNGLFAQAVDYLYRTGKVKDQKELSVLTGITETTISRILNDKVKEPSELTLRKFNNAFGGIFNMDYFRGKSVILLMEDIVCSNDLHLNESENKENKYILDVGSSSSSVSAAEKDPIPFIPAWADSFFDIMTQQIKQNEALNRELRKTISQVAELTEKLSKIIDKI